MSISRALLITGLGLFSNNPCIAQQLAVDVAAVKTLVSEWNAAHTPDDIENLSSLYSETVTFYGSNLSRQKCLTVKKAMLEKDKDFKQTLKDDLLLSGYSTGTIRCDFVKTVSQNGKAFDYESYLIVKAVGGSYLIIGESDLVTDRRIKNDPDLGTRVEIKDAEDALVISAVNEKRDSQTSSNPILYLGLIGGSFVIGVIGLLFALRTMRKPAASKRPLQVARALQQPVASKKPADVVKDVPRLPPASWPSEDVIPNFQNPAAPKDLNPTPKALKAQITSGKEKHLKST